MTAAKRAATFRLDDELVDGLQQIKDSHGIPLTEQVTRALEMWLETMGVSVRRPAGGKSMKLVERLRGVGRVLNEKGSDLGPASYDLSIWQEVHQVRTFGGTNTVDGLREIQGTVTGKAASLVGEGLVLRLEDERTLPFFFTASSGAIAARGQLSEK